MRKLLALALAAAMVFSLAACGGGSGSGGASDGADAVESAAPAADAADAAEPASAEGSVPSPHANEDGSVNLDMVAYYDPNYDYTQNERLRVAYITGASGPLYQEANEAYGVWCGMENMEYLGMSSSEGDNDMYMTLLQNHLDQGIDILILDPDTTIWPSVAAVLENYPDVAWMGMMASARTADGALNHPFCSSR